MKKLSLIVVIVAVIFSLPINNFGQVKVQSETQVQFNDDYSGVNIERIQLSSNVVNFKYDNKVNINDKKVNDVASLFSNGLVKTKDFTFDVGYIGVLDYQQSDEHFLDIYAKKQFKNISVSLELGRGVGEKQKPRDYFISRIAHKYFTIEVGAFSKNGYNNLSGFLENKYYWGALHNDHYFVALGNEVTRTHAIASTKGFKDFGNFTFGNYDRANGDFWIRSQTGIMNVNQEFFSQENCLTSANYLILTAFHYIWFSPMSTKGSYTFRVDAKKTGGIEKKDFMFGKQLGQIGQFAVGLQNQIGNGNGVVAEYYNSVSFGKFSTLISLRYESLGNIGTAFIRGGYTF